MNHKKNTPFALIILDGWGLRKSRKGNAIALGKTPNIDSYYKRYPNSRLISFGEKVGLPRDKTGNSEIGHMTIGAGRVIRTDLVRINRSIRDGSFFRNKVLRQSINHTKKNKSALHLLGLLSDGGVHSEIDHLFALLKLAKKMNVKERIYVHAILDGRDTHPRAAKGYIRMLEKEIKKLKIDCKIATIMGRFYGMDRDNRWNREHKAYDAMVNKKGRVNIYRSIRKELKDPIKHIYRVLDGYYKKGIGDEFIPPTITNHGTVEEGDSIIFFNFRSDRARETTRAFVQGRFNKFKRKKILNLNFVCLTQYDKKIRAPVAFPPIRYKRILAEILCENGFRQCRIAETEKYAHVTFFFNAGRESPFGCEKRVLIPSKRVSTYDKVPGMSAGDITRKIIKNIKKGNCDFFVINFANGDMVGHTGNISAAKKAVHVVDSCVGRVIKEVLKKQGTAIITADHGNCEDMIGKKQTAHAANPVPFILINKELTDKNTRLKLRNGSLADIAPTILSLLGVKKPKEMDGKSLIRKG